MCLYPKLIRNKKYTANKKNGGNIPVVRDERTLMVPVGCGKCIECMKQKAREWSVRMMEEIRENSTGKFVTLTFKNESLTKLSKIVEEGRGAEKREKKEEYILENEVATVAVRKFLERWRKKYKKSVRHWLVTELGHNGTERIHLHGILFTEVDNDTIEKIWNYGHIWVGNYVNEKTVNYIVKYVNKMDIDHKGYKPKVLCSPGLGSGYLNRRDSRKNKYQLNGMTEESYRHKSGAKNSLPIYYRNKIYTEEQREKLWLEKLDKQERWVGGERIDISQGEEDYYRTLNHYRLINKQLGYGDDSKEWNMSTYIKNRQKLRKHNKTNEC